jgi:hypothetical protein
LLDKADTANENDAPDGKTAHSSVNAPAGNAGEEAMRILEGLINKPARQQLVSPPSKSELTKTDGESPYQVKSMAQAPSPRTKITEKVKGSLSTLSSSLDLRQTLSKSNEDLIARLAKLRSKAADL